MTLKKPPTNKTIYQLKITLKSIRPPIWRRVLVDSDITLQHLDSIVQAAMGWYGGHLHIWTIGDFDYGQPHKEYGDNILNEKNVKLSKVLGGQEKVKFYYTYDFGDDWQHEIVLEKILPPEADIKYPVCVTGKRACPPEDCGGFWGYDELLSIINHPEDPEYEERMEWLGGDFDPEEFDLKLINTRLQKLR